ncbi:hypothetical protein KC367_g6698 [Hortaea werneckii]|nr:hypothetical protein KC342_g8421 [Hortaea werneckii]KAI7097567.1 hypothetical protein KC339_g9593 [Hortaea werneckii]KAI7204136.1 hypothetical protein KC365_g18067 [Hortaea werneckii]KAI7315134.1 hypothetical protein KC340_g9086 [Hortaea werneckii]KAI7387284.1 hypothetical protein KC328_g9512 [Hortaea werneckii]
MAEKVYSPDAPAIARRPSFRKTLREHEASLPEDFLRALEEKRRQLDESIHKYIAAKEREWKQFEKDIRQQARTRGAGSGPTSSHAPQHDACQDETTASRRRASSDSAHSANESPQLRGQQSSAVDALLATGLRRDGSAQALAGMNGRRESVEREKDFVGLFTPSFLPAIDNKRERQHERTASAPGIVEASASKHSVATVRSSLQKADSDTVIQAKAKRPAHLQEGQRNSSSGSLAESRLLTSAMKSPVPLGHASRQQKKRVSLAVGDSIVAPSDNVPLPLSNSSTPSHSRSRSPVNDLDPVANAPGTSVADFAKQPPAKFSLRGENTMNGLLSLASGQPGATDQESSARPPAAPSAAARPSPATRSPSRIDPDGDLFDLDEDSDLPTPRLEEEEPVPGIEGEEEITPGIGGRIDQQMAPLQPQRHETSTSEPGLRPGEVYDYDSEAGLVPEPVPGAVPEVVEQDEHAMHVEFGSIGASASSQQPTRPGFRRPSVVSDPVFLGQDYEQAEERAVNDDIYGSSYSRPPTKGSFTGGSLGESYMARHAEEMMRVRMAKQQQDVRS